MARRISVAVMACSVSVALAFGLYNGVSPADADAQTIRHMEAAAAAVRNAHVVTWMSDYKTDNDTVTHHGSLDQVEELWYEDGRTRKEGAWGSRLIVGATDAAKDAQGRRYLRTPGKYYRYDPRAGKVTAIQESGLQWSHFTLNEIAGDLLSRPPSAMETLGETTLKGQKAREISVAISRDTAAMNHSPAPGDIRGLFWISTETDLPLRIAAERYEAGQWTTKAKYEFEFNQNLSPALFDPATLKQ